MLQAENGAGALHPVDSPSLPEGYIVLGDALLTTDPAGRVWFSGLVQGPERPGDPRGPAYVQVARSGDPGQTWARNELLGMSAPGDETNESSSVDRQWLVFDSAQHVYVFATAPHVVHAQFRVTEDGGETWSDPQPVLETQGRLGPLGRPAVGPDGTLVTPYFVATADLVMAEQTGLVAAAVSKDGGQTWTRTLVSADPMRGTAQGFHFPMAAAGPNGTFHVSWINGDGQAVVASSTAPSEAWNEPTVISPENTTAPSAPHPWIETTMDGTLVASWYANAEGEYRALAAWQIPTGSGFETKYFGSTDQSPGDHGPHLSISDDGRVAIAWTNPRQSTNSVRVIAPFN